jgi:hypothetical protein
MQDKRSGWRSLLWTLSAIVIMLFMLVDELARPIYRPLLDWIARWRFMERFEAMVAPLPRFVILVLFGVPFAIAEPLKVFALLLVAKGLVATGIGLLIFAYLVTFLIVERIYHAGQHKLLTYLWFAWAMKQIGAVRDVLVSVKVAAMAQVRSWIRPTGPGA